MKHVFSQIPSTDMPRSTFDRSHYLKTAFDSGYLIPLECQECLPGDEIDFNAKFFARLAPVVTPVMDKVFFDLQAFFVPSRIVWTNFTKMMGERVNPKDSIDYVVPKINSGEFGFPEGSLADYFGIPINTANIDVNALPFRAYAKIWDDWYRDENLQDSIIQSSDDLGDSNGSIEWNTLLRRGKRHDYFTSCLPTPQKGAGVNLPLGATAPVVGTKDGFTAPTGYTLDATGLKEGVQISQYYNQGSVYLTGVHSKDGTQSLGFDKSVGLVADLSEATAATINSLRMAFQLQRMLEADNRAGTRYKEILLQHFKTVCPDARLQRPEYLGGSSTQIEFTPVAQTSATQSGTTPQANLSATAQVLAGVNFKKSCTEHGYLILLGNVRAELSYQQGLHRMWTRSGRYDFFWPTLQHLGEQAVLEKELVCYGNSGAEGVNDDSVFGYQERYAEYRYNPSLVTGAMRSDCSKSLDNWHLSQYFESQPVLDSEFIQDNPPLQRVLAVTSGVPQVILDGWLGQKWTRPMATYSIPGLIDHL